MSVAFVCWGSGDWGNVYWGYSFFLLGTGDNPDSWLFMWLVPLEPPLMFPLLFPLFVRQFGGFLVFLAFSAPFFSDLFPWASQASLVLVVWGGALLEEGYPGWAI